MARSLGQVMSTMVVQERHLWLNLVQMSDANKVRFLDTPISQAGLFSYTIEDFAQQFSAVQKQTETIKHNLLRRKSTQPPGARPPPRRCRGCPPAASTPAPPPATSKEATPQPGRRTGHRRLVQPDTGYPEMVEIALRGTQTSAPPPPGECDFADLADFADRRLLTSG
ncbi:hypothetical protein M9458_033222, partial [Cirrhinus mrigala]